MKFRFADIDGLNEREYLKMNDKTKNPYKSRRIKMRERLVFY
jgi:hypothetical protein